MKKIIGIILIIVAIVLTGLGLSFNKFFNKSEKKEELPTQFNIVLDKSVDKNGKEFANTLKDIVLSKDSNLDDIKKLIDQDIQPYFIIIGKDNYMKTKPKVNTKEDLSKYDEIAKKYSDILEDTYLSKTKFEISEDSDHNVIVKITPWNFSFYRQDLGYLIGKLSNFNQERINISSDEDNQKILVKQYKALVNGMKILNNHLDDYENDGEVIEHVIHYTDGKADKYDMYTLFKVMGGTMESEVRESIVDQYIEEAITKGSIDRNNPLELK